MNRQEHLEKIKDAVIYNLKKVIIDEGLSCSGDLINSINGTISSQAIEVSFNAYGVYVDKGTKPLTGPKIEPGLWVSLQNWFRCRNIPQNAWGAIYTSLRKKGVTPHPWTYEFEETLLDFSNEILELTYTDVSSAIDENFKKIWK